MEFKDRIASYIQACSLLVEGDAPVLVTLSGGADSVALLRVLVDLGYTCHAAHCNFHLRGDESNRDERFVTALCQSLGVTLHLRHMDVPAYQRAHKVSVEMACRELRYEWFAALAAELHCQAIAVAHHADDNIETFFLNALRGSGIAGLAGMKPRNGNIVRPLLCVSRADVEHYLLSLGQEYVTDSTNLANDYQRNKIRNVVVPAIEREFSSARNTLAATVDHVRDYADLFQDLMADLAQRISTHDGDVCRISIAGLLALKSDRLTLLLLELLKACNVSAELCRNIADVITRNTAGGQRFYTSTHTLSLTEQYIVAEPTVYIYDDAILVDFNNLTELKVKLQLKRSCDTPFSPEMCDGKHVVAFSSGLLGCRKAVLRHWREGDRMRPFGMKGTKLVSDIFTDMKMSPEARKAVWLLEVDGKVVWLLGVRAADACRVPLGSTDYVLLEYCQ